MGEFIGSHVEAGWGSNFRFLDIGYDPFFDADAFLKGPFQKFFRNTKEAF